MEASIKVIHTQTKKAKNGNEYKLVHVVVTIGGQEFVRKFAIFS